MNKEIFTPEERQALVTPYPVRIEDCLRKNRAEQALVLCEELKESQVVLHDFFADSCTVLWSWVGQHLGEETIEDMFRYVFEQSMRRQIFDIGGTVVGFPPHLGAFFLAKVCWRAHSCFQAGDHPGDFSITEDSEKFSFHMQPCGSGGRLWRRGLYEPGRGGKVSETARTWTYNRQGFPYYCIHCSFLNEILPYEAIGALMWPVDPLEGPDDVCTWHLYKDPNRIPDRYYERLGLTKKAFPFKESKERYFSEEELHEMARPSTERLQEKIRAGDFQGARSICRDVKDEFLFLHDLYVQMLVATLTFISDRAGEASLEQALTYQFEKCVKEQIGDKLEALDFRQRTAFLAQNIFGVDSCNGAGFPKAKFAMTETEETVIFTLDPCGSGGRLLRAGGYEPLTRGRRWREDLENRLIRTSSRYLPDSVMEWSLRQGGLYLIAKTTYSQGRTSQGHPWSFGRKGVPYYCCQCGMLQDRLPDSCLTIIPPADRRAPCVWKLKKNPVV